VIKTGRGSRDRLYRAADRWSDEDDPKVLLIANSNLSTTFSALVHSGQREIARRLRHSGLEKSRSARKPSPTKAAFDGLVRAARRACQFIFAARCRQPSGRAWTSIVPEFGSWWEVGVCPDNMDCTSRHHLRAAAVCNGLWRPRLGTLEAREKACGL